MARDPRKARRQPQPRPIGQAAGRRKRITVTITSLRERNHYLAAVTPNRGHLRAHLLVAVKETARDHLAKLTPTGVTFFSALTPEDLAELTEELEGWLERT